MPKYDVSITRTLELTTTITVTATNEDEAEEKALQQIQKSQITWSIEDNNDWEEQSDDCTVDVIDRA